MVFINDSGTFAIIYNGLTTNITGDEPTTLIILLVIMFAFFFAFNFKVEWALIFLLPLTLVSFAYISLPGTILFCILYILAVVLKENFI